jgi:hypothetical protein
MDYLQYSYIARPGTAQVSNFLQALADHGVSISHLGKSDPPCKLRVGGSMDEAVSIVFSDTDTTNWTFARDAARELDFDFQIHHDPEWTHSTVSASCPDLTVLDLVAESAAGAFDLFITIRGVSCGGKEQRWAVVHVTESCPHELRSRFVVA